jgi:hypothetical protein
MTSETQPSASIAKTVAHKAEAVKGSMKKMTGRSPCRRRLRGESCRY